MIKILTRKRLILTACLALVVALGVLGTAGYLAFVRGPANPPAEACGQESAQRVVNAGASMTQGTLGGDWVGALRAKPEFTGHEFVNAGINGDTSAGLLARLDEDVIACHPAAVTILVGTNDVRNGVPLPEYRANLTEIVRRIQTGTTARIALMSLPPLGEDPDTEINHKLAGYNAAIKETADQTPADYLPVHERMSALLTHGVGHQRYDFGFPTALWAATQHYVFGRSWDDVTRGAGRELLVDHIHLNDRGAAQLTELTAEWLAR